MRNKVLVTRKIPDTAIELLESSGFQVRVYNNKAAMTYDELREAITDKDALISMLTLNVDKGIIDNANNLKIIANFAVGFDNIDVEYANSKNIMVTNTPNVLTDTTAELALALMFTSMRKIIEAHIFTSSGKFKGWEPNLILGYDLKGKVLGVIGAGRIGTALIEKASGLGMNFAYYSNHTNEYIEKNFNAKKVDLYTLLKISDIVSIHLPLTKDTYHLIGENELKMMKKNAILINTARGPIIEQNALIQALDESWIGGAAIDVYEFEPELPLSLRKQKNAILTPHIGSATFETREKMALMTAQSIIDFFNGKPPQNIVGKNTL